MEQPASVRLFITITIIWIPFALSIIAFFIKARFPFKTEPQVRMIAAGIAKQKCGEKAEDPLSKCMYGKPYTPQPAGPGDSGEDAERKNREYMWFDLLDTFPGLEVLNSFLDDYKNSTEKEPELNAALWVLRWKVIRETVFSWCWLVGFTILTIWTFPLLDEDLQYIPVIAVVCAGLGITLVLLAAMRLKASKLLIENPPSKEFLEKMKERRTSILALADYELEFGTIFYDREGKETEVLQEEI